MSVVEIVVHDISRANQRRSANMA